MSLFPRNLVGVGPDANFTSLFRLLDDFDTYNREVHGTQDGGQDGSTSRRLAVQSFNPRFDVRETRDAYELHGELPGIDRENVNIEFTDAQTIAIRGRIERKYTSGTPPAAAVTDETAEAAKEQGSGSQAVKRQGEHTDKPKTPAEKYWVSERSIGEFSRTFSFPSRVDQEAVSANLSNGILSLVIPKAKKIEARRIAIN